MSRTIFEKSQPQQHAYSLPKSCTEFEQLLPPKELLRTTPLPLPEISELDLMRHFSELARKNMGIDTHFYPLGSCTMKYNPRVNELCAHMTGFTRTHPLAPDQMVQGNLQIIFELISLLCQTTGMAAGSLLPNAGAQGEFAGIQMISAYHQKRGDFARKEVLIPDNAHGTNPATAALAGLQTISIKTTPDGDIDLAHLEQALSGKTAALMLTNPNTLGLFSPSILKAAALVHQKGGLLYYDGANLNAILEIVGPGEMGFDVIHINLHKTFSTPHGGGGPGSGPIFCNRRLEPFLPVPRVIRKDGCYETVFESKDSIGKIASFHGNFLIYLRAYVYARLHGHYGLRRIAEQAVLNANYLKSELKDLFKIPYPQACMHEFVIQADTFLSQGVKALDIAKRLLDYGIHAPTVYFPLIVKECLLIEPTESESKATLDQFVAAMRAIIKEIKETPELVKGAPYTQSVTRLDEVLAAKKPILKHTT